LMRERKDQAELFLHPEYLTADEYFYTRGGRRRQTFSTLKDGGSLNVDLTEKSIMYMNHINPFIQFADTLKQKRKELFSPENVLVITDGLCASSCSQFIKAVGQKHLARIVAVGLHDPRDPNARFDAGIASSASATSVSNIQNQKNNINFSYLMNTTNIPLNLFRNVTMLGFADRELYGYTEDTKDKLLEYEIIDADFRYEFANNINEVPTTEQQLEEFYRNILKSEENYFKQAIDQGQLSFEQDGEGEEKAKKCLSWEIDFAQAAIKGNCKRCSRLDQHSVFGYPCTTRGITDKEGRNADGTAKIGIYDTNKCIFSHCKVGYYRKNVQVNGSFIDQCIEIPLAYKETRQEMTPDQSEDIFTDQDVCGDQCFNITSTTPTDLCPCPTDPGKLDDDPRKDGLCKCKNIIETTPVNTCACPTDQQKLDQDPRKDGL
ncbi:MAG: hypothetical protein EZS28_044906, partial [Streblomastix strix]